MLVSDDIRSSQPNVTLLRRSEDDEMKLWMFWSITLVMKYCEDGADKMLKSCKKEPMHLSVNRDRCIYREDAQ